MAPSNFGFHFISHSLYTSSFFTKHINSFMSCCGIHTMQQLSNLKLILSPLNVLTLINMLRCYYTFMLVNLQMNETRKPFEIRSDPKVPTIVRVLKSL